MKDIYKILIKNGFNSDEAWNQLELSGFEILYALEESERAELVIKTDNINKLKKFTFIDLCEPFELQEINYSEEWGKHAPNFIDGKVHLSLPNGKKILLLPGAGFGDFSHPTTQICLELMQDYKEEIVIDIGTGSGILALAALASGAKKAIAIDIDPSAINHAKENAALNNFNNIEFYLPNQWKPLEKVFYLIFMNMITSEQENAWKSFTSELPISGTLILSGILEDQEKDFTIFSRKFGWKIIKILKKEGWLGAVCSLKVPFKEEDRYN